MAISLPFGSGNSGVNDWSDVYGNDSQLVTELDARDSVYRTLFGASAALVSGSGSTTYIMTGVGGVGTGLNILSYSTQIFYFASADYSVSSKTQKLRVRAQVATNGTAPGVTFSIAMFPITSSGASGNLALTTGTAVSGSVVSIAAPATNSITQGSSGDFTIPSDGAYALAVNINGPMPANAASLIAATVQTRWV